MRCNAQICFRGNLTGSKPLLKLARNVSRFASVKEEDLIAAINAGNEEFDRTIAKEAQLLSRGLAVRKWSTAHLQALKTSTSAIHKNVMNGRRVVEASKQLKKRWELISC